MLDFVISSEDSPISDLGQDIKNISEMLNYKSARKMNKKSPKQLFLKSQMFELLRKYETFESIL